MSNIYYIPTVYIYMVYIYKYPPFALSFHSMVNSLPVFSPRQIPVFPR